LAAKTPLGIKKTKLFKLIKEYRKDPRDFSVTYKRSTPNNQTKASLRGHLVGELQQEKEMITNPLIPVK
jgi:hypothetical protein